MQENTDVIAQPKSEDPKAEGNLLRGALKLEALCHRIGETSLLKEPSVE